ncbi:MAG: hypothetical protein KA388_11595 [Rhodocyclaceae bacterium]|nr:hypothetical protein [Rhodocyclaceae bacterium]MBP6109593.1 hypothetical protein [Rhodocyclaceae bacterium]MBP6280394.1 hypothetical protein [Rhodocyclaceae bacterium]
MPRLTIIASLLAFCAFNVAQYRGWNAFADEVQAQQSNKALRSGNHSSGGYSQRSYHK